jgi:hypothetical protein
MTALAMVSAGCSGRRTSREPPLRYFQRYTALAQSVLEKLAEAGMLVDQAVDQIVTFFQRNQLKRRSAVDGDYDRLAVVVNAGLKLHQLAGVKVHQ